MELAEGGGGARAVVPDVLEPARPDLRVGAAVDPALGPVASRGGRSLLQVAVVAEGEAAGRIVERLRVRELERRELGGAAEMDEEARRFACADARRARVVGEARTSR